MEKALVSLVERALPAMSGSQVTYKVGTISSCLLVTPVPPEIPIFKACVCQIVSL